MQPETERRRYPRVRKAEADSLQVGVRHAAAGIRVIDATPIDFSEGGLGIRTRAPLEVGKFVTVWGRSSTDQAETEEKKSARVVYCRQHEEAAYRAGCVFEEPGKETRYGSGTTAHAFVDYYEVLQVSPNASPETIQRVYRMMAQTYHPDNPDTGNHEAFQLLLRAYQTLNDAERRAAYDVAYYAERAIRWKIFDQPKAAMGVEAEKRKRQALLSILYTKRMEDPEEPLVRLRDCEELIGCAREHLVFSAWYLREQELIRQEDYGRYTITAKGVEFAEQHGLWDPRDAPKMLEEGRPDPEAEES